MRVFVAAILLSAAFSTPPNLWAQQDGPPPAPPPPADQVFRQNPAPASNTPLYHDLNLLRRDDFAAAERASVSLRVTTKDGVTPAPLRDSDYTLMVNNTRRVGRLHVPGESTHADVPLVLLVFPPNQPIVHAIAVKQAERYFASQPAELLPWRVALFDSNGKLMPFTDGRSQLLAFLDVVEHTVEPFQFTGDAALSAYYGLQSRWQREAEEAISNMQAYQGPKILLAMNPLGEPTYGLNEAVLAHDGPESLVAVAQSVGAHMYIANVGGPEPIVPGGSAAEPATPGGTKPSFHMQLDPAQIAALNASAANASQMMQSAQSTLGGFANSLDELARQIHRDFDGNYTIDFDLTPEDRDEGVPSVEVRPNRRDLHTLVLDVIPIGPGIDSTRQAKSTQLNELMAMAVRGPVTSPDFNIAQQVDFFPMRSGLEPILPMSCVVAWSGVGRPPPNLLVVESVEDKELSSMILARDLEAGWNGKRLSWERDGQLRPGTYIWRVAVHDATGKLLASAEQKIEVEFPRSRPVVASSLVLGKSCKVLQPEPGLQRGRAAESPRRPKLSIDPMRAGDCRLLSEATANFSLSDQLRALVRIYPAERFRKHQPANWTATFVLRSESGSIEGEQELPFIIDSGSGYLASVELPLNDAQIHPGAHTLEVEMRGPGLRHGLKKSRAISIQASSRP